MLYMTDVDDNIPVFSSNLEHALKELVQSPDPLDAADFDPIEHINAFFPDEESLAEGKLENHLKDLRSKVLTLSDTIQRDVREFSSQRSRTTASVEKSTRALEELFLKIRAIQTKAEHSEVMVQEICRDIKSLDYAKKNLSASILALKNLHMLVSLVEELERVSKAKNYRKAVGLLCAIDDLLGLFEQYKDVPKISALSNQVQRTKDELKTQIFAELKKSLPNSPLLEDAEHLRMLHEACQVVDVMEEKTKADFFSWFTKKQMEVYEAGYAPGEEGGTLVAAERRFPWLRRELRSYDEKFGKIFPVKWNVPGLLSKEFCLRTRTHLKVILANEKASDVAALIRALQRTVEMERELAVRFKAATYHDAVRDYEARDPDDEAATMGVVEAIKQKHKNRERDNRERDNRERSSDSGEAVSEVVPLDFQFERSMSEAFSPYMSVYVQHERQTMESLIYRVKAEEKWVLDEKDEDEDKHLKGCDEVLLYIKGSVKRCTKLTKGDILFKLFQEYEKILAMYVDVLRTRLPVECVQDESQLAKGIPPREPSPLSKTQIGSLCLIVSTAEYCAQTLPALENSLKKQIDEQFTPQVNLENVGNSLRTVLNQAIEAIATGICAKLSKALVAMLKIPWATLERVGDQSAYVNQINDALKEDLPMCTKLLSESHHSFLCTRLVAIFIPKFLESIYKTRRVAELGAQQLSLDATAIKSIMNNIPLIEETITEVDEAGNETIQASKRKVTRVFSRRVKKEMTNVEAVLKTLSSPSESIIMTLKAMQPDFVPQDLTNIMNLRGLKRSEQQALVDAYNASQTDASQYVMLAAGNTTTDIRKLFKIY